MAPNVPAVLNATAGAIPTLLLPLALQQPFVALLARRSGNFRAAMEQLESDRAFRIFLRVAQWVTPVASGVVAGTRVVLSNFARTVIVLSGLGILTSIGLQSLPTTTWQNEPLGWAVVGAHLFVVAILVLLVADSFLLLLKAANSVSGQPVPPGPGSSGDSEEPKTSITD